MLPDPDALADVVIETVETALGPVLADLKALRLQIASWEARWSDLGALRERVAVVEAKAATPGLLVPPTNINADAGLAEMRDRMTALEGRVNADTLTAAVADLRERVAVVEVRAPIPGPPGADGAHGLDGKDGLGFEDLDVSLSGDRTLVFRFARGDQEKTFRVVAGWPVYQKNWIQGKAYVPGDVVTWDGSEWACLAAADDGQPGVSPVWYRSVTKGRAGAPGRDGKDFTPPAVPVVKVGVR